VCHHAWLLHWCLKNKIFLSKVGLHNPNNLLYASLTSFQFLPMATDLLTHGFCSMLFLHLQQCSLQSLPC
jgi:hypothetical protein